MQIKSQLLLKIRRNKIKSRQSHKSIFRELRQFDDDEEIFTIRTIKYMNKLLVNGLFRLRRDLLLFQVNLSYRISD